MSRAGLPHESLQGLRSANVSTKSDWLLFSTFGFALIASQNIEFFIQVSKTRPDHVVRSGQVPRGTRHNLHSLVTQHQLPRD